MSSSNLILYITFIALLILTCILYYIFDTKVRFKIMTKRKLKKLNKLRERIEFYGFLTDICRDMANKSTMHRNNYRTRSEFFCELEHKAVGEYNKLNGEIMTNEEKNDMFTEVILWHKVKRRPMTKDEKQEYAELDIYGEKIEEIYVGSMPDDGQEILVKTRWGGVDTDIAYVDGNYIGLEGVGDWEDVEYWAEMPRGE